MLRPWVRSAAQKDSDRSSSEKTVDYRRDKLRKLSSIYIAQKPKQKVISLFERLALHPKAILQFDENRLQEPCDIPRFQSRLSAGRELRGHAAPKLLKFIGWNGQVQHILVVERVGQQIKTV